MTHEQSIQQIGHLILNDEDGPLIIYSDLKSDDGKCEFLASNEETGANYIVRIEIIEL